MAVAVKSTVFWVVPPCNSDGARRFGGTCLQIECRSVNEAIRRRRPKGELSALSTASAENWDHIFFRNVGVSPNWTELQHGIPDFSIPTVCSMPCWFQSVFDPPEMQATGMAGSRTSDTYLWRGADSGSGECWNAVSAVLSLRTCGCGRCSWTLETRPPSGNCFSDTRTLPPAHFNNKIWWFIFSFSSRSIHVHQSLAMLTPESVREVTNSFWSGAQIPSELLLTGSCGM
jgi:hypothetical protein